MIGAALSRRPIPTALALALTPSAPDPPPSSLRPPPSALRLSPPPHPKQARNHASPYDFSRLDGFRDRVCLLVSPGDPWCCSEVRATRCHAVAHCVRGVLHAWRVARGIALSAQPVASPHTSRAAATSLRAAPRRRACPCIAWPGCPTPSARSAPRAPRSSPGSPRPCASCAAAAARAAALAWPQAYGPRPRAARRDRLRAHRRVAGWGLPRDAHQESCRVSRRSNRCGLACLACTGLEAGAPEEYRSRAPTRRDFFIAARTTPIFRCPGSAGFSLIS